MACFSEQSQNDAFGSASKGKGMDARTPYLATQKRWPGSIQKGGEGKGYLHTNRA